MAAQIMPRGFASAATKERYEAEEAAEPPHDEELEDDQSGATEETPVDLTEVNRQHCQSNSVQRVAELEAKLAEAAEKLKEMQLKYRISLDNCEQMEKINAKKLDNANLYAITRFAKDMLDVADTFELAFKSLGAQKEATGNDEFIEGIRLTETQLHKTFDKYGIKRFESLNETFNPEVHEAMFEIPNDDVDKNTVLQVVFNGYMINNRVLRPAKVGVSRK